MSFLRFQKSGTCHQPKTLASLAVASKINQVKSMLLSAPLQKKLQHYEKCFKNLIELQQSLTKPYSIITAPYLIKCCVLQFNQFLLDIHSSEKNIETDLEEEEGSRDFYGKMMRSLEKEIEFFKFNIPKENKESLIAEFKKFNTPDYTIFSKRKQKSKEFKGEGNDIKNLREQEVKSTPPVETEICAVNLGDDKPSHPLLEKSPPNTIRSFSN